ncbi:MAG TPA: hypothetical protein H9824_02560 [Candidatus Bacteroides pullicola]|uniref:Tetratricopeptide repeat protein n=1 Tax=Candidatus Bacteroides pullicola TaxID=2838475 RepID=A0A9D1ZH02_9BACE|nr:hypothetical protein [Candidatus Bacteroides pullicola]
MIGKHVLYLLIICIGCTLAACNPSSDENVKAKLAQAEDIMYSAPDSALQLLEHLQPPKEKEQRATWALLLAQARYRNNVKQSDSLVNVAYDYFEKTDNAERKALSSYIKGGISGDNGDTDKEQELYLEAKDEVRHTKDYRLAFLITSNLCNLYAYRGLKEYAFEALEEAHHYAQLFGDAEYILSSYIFHARIHSIRPINMEKSLHYYREGIKLAKENQNWAKLELMTWEYIGMLCFNGDYEQALQEAHETMELQIPDHLRSKHTLILGNIYRGLDKYDSAYYYLNKTIRESQSPHTKKGAYNYLYNLERERGRYEEALAACEQCLIYTDSIDRSEKAQELIEMQAKYDQQQIIIQRNLLQMEKDRLTRNILILAVVMTVVIGFVVGCYQRALLTKQRKLKQQEELARQNTLKLAENEIQMSRNKQRIAELTQQITSNQELKEQLDEQLEAIKQMKGENNKLQAENQLLLEDINRQTQTFKDISKELEELDRLISQNKHLHEQGDHLAMLLVNRSPLLNKIKNRHPYIKDAEWGELEEELDLIFEHYPKRLQQQVSNISESELRLAYLIKLKMPNKDMAEALGISPASVAKSKMRLKERLSHGILTFDGTKSVDVWLWDF